VASNLTDNDYGLVQHVDANGTITTVIGQEDGRRSNRQGRARVGGCTSHGPATSCWNPNGNLYVTDMRLKHRGQGRHTRHRHVDRRTVEAGSTGDGGPATQAELDFPSGLAMDTQGNLYITETNGNVIREVDTHGVIHTFAGTGVEGFG
jgi:sugar lactone lactonase YvrE